MKVVQRMVEVSGLLRKALDPGIRKDSIRALG